MNFLLISIKINLITKIDIKLLKIVNKHLFLQDVLRSIDEPSHIPAARSASYHDLMMANERDNRVGIIQIVLQHS
jgi:hypothetical protein